MKLFKLLLFVLVIFITGCDSNSEGLVTIKANAPIKIKATE